MIKVKYLSIILTSIIILILINSNSTSKKKDITDNTSISDPTFKTENNDIMVYNQEGTLNYRIITPYAEYFSKQRILWFTRPLFMIYDSGGIQTWLIKSDKAKLTNDHMLYLYDNIEVNASTIDSKLRKITSNNIQINLVTQDIKSQDLVTIYGTTFNSSGLRMKGNLRNKNAELIEKVKTLYEIQNK